MGCKRLRKPRHMSAGGILTSAASGAAAGAAFGGFGAIPGAAIGLGAGILNDIKEKDLQKANLAQQQLVQRQRSFAGGLEAQPANIPLMPLGGLIPYDNERVELEAGEPFQSPNGAINSIPGGAPTHAQGGVTVDLPNGTEVLGKLKNTEGKQFKMMGRKLENAQAKYIRALQNNPTNIASTTAERMLSNIQAEFNDLFVEQEEVKNNGRGGQTQFPDGGAVGDTAAQNVLRNYRPQTIQAQEYGDFGRADFGDLLRSRPLYSPTKRDSIVTTENYYKGVPGPQYAVPGSMQGARVNKYTTPGGQTRFAGSEAPKLRNGGMIRKGQTGLLTGENDFDYLGQPLNGNNVGPTYGVQQPQYTAPQTQQFTNATGGTPTNTIPGADEIVQPLSTDTAPGFNFSNALGTIGSLAPVALNLAQGLGKSEQLNASDYYNPYEDQARSAMRKRRYNAQPELEANRLAEATYYRNLRGGAPSQSQFLGGLQAGAIGKSRADASTIARQQNVNNQYLADQAQTDIQLGAQRAQTDLGIKQFNLQSDASRRNLLRTGATQVGQFAQNKQLMNNQILRDAQRLGLLEDLVSNYNFKDGKWTFKVTGQEQSQEEIMNFIKGRK